LPSAPLLFEAQPANGAPSGAGFSAAAGGLIAQSGVAFLGRVRLLIRGQQIHDIQALQYYKN
jgi:hypothetical protein